MKNESDYIQVEQKDVMNLLQQGKPRIVTNGIMQTESIMAAVAFAKSKGYKVSLTRNDDPADPGGCMSMVGTYHFTLS